jgi:hypothetical protein
MVKSPAFLALPLFAAGLLVAIEATGGTNVLILRHDLLAEVTDVVSYQASASTMTPDGRFIAFVVQTNASDLGNVYLWDAQSGTRALVSVSSNGGTSTNGNGAGQSRQ